ncbi:hypothetical protein DFJ74DRAFT_712705 [Hyaloraphidium curvatum]|nr:hypothetical protein DFJ74DRAFT_712705 [Hyaloraphidium curvatum]
MPEKEQGHRPMAQDPPKTPAERRPGAEPPKKPARVLLTLDYRDMAGDIAPDDDFETACNKSGKNVGNLVWLHAASNYIMDRDKNVVRSLRNIEGKADAVVIPSSNILLNVSRLEINSRRDELIRSFPTLRGNGKSPEPRFIIGIGVEGVDSLGTSASKHHGDLGEVYTRMITPSDYVLHPLYVDTLRAIISDGGAIGVRGPFTERLLRRYGVRGAVALGCPSLFAHPDPALGSVIQAKIAALGPHSRIAFNMPQRWVPRLMAFLLRMAMQSKRHKIVWQSPTDYWYAKRAQYELGIKVPREKILWFRSYGGWSEAMCGFDAIVGSRIHGNMIGLACPTPMLLIASDIRTHEMGEAMGIPMLRTDHPMFQELAPKLDAQIAGGKGNASEVTVDLPSLAELFGAARFNATAFDRNRYLQASRYERILTRMGIVPSERIRALAPLHRE